MIKNVMAKRTREQKIKASVRRSAEQSVAVRTSSERTSTSTDQFRRDARKSALIISVIIALEIILYFGTII